MTHPDTERAVASLPAHLQRRMARLVLGGWKFEPVGTAYSSWTATHPNNWRKLYSGSTLLTLLNQMVGVVEDTEAGVYESFDMRGIREPHRLPDAADGVAAILRYDELPPR